MARRVNEQPFRAAGPVTAANCVAPSKLGKEQEQPMNATHTVCRGNAKSPISRAFNTMERARDFVRQRIAEGVPPEELYVSAVKEDGTTNLTYFTEEELEE